MGSLKRFTKETYLNIRLTNIIVNVFESSVKLTRIYIIKTKT